MELNLPAEKYLIVLNCLSNFKLKNVEALWDGRGSLEFEFNPQISDIYLRNELAETLSEIIEDAGIIWNLNIEILSSSNSEVKLELIETRNLSSIGDITFENSDFLSPEVYNYILTKYDLNLEECECVISHSQSGNHEVGKNSDGFYYKGLEFSSIGSFLFIVFKHNEEINVSDEELENIICRVVHTYIINFCSMDLSYFDYNFDFIDGQLNDISLTLSPVNLTLKKMN
jgi:hypothetical protein